MTGTRGVVPGPSTLVFTVVTKLFSCSFGLMLEELVDSGPRAGFGLTELADVEAVGRSELMLDVVVVAVMQVLMLGCRMLVGFSPTCGFDIGPQTERTLPNSTIQSEMADFRAFLGW